jgi:DNA-binding PadR family transcriptional regulator
VRSDSPSDSLSSISLSASAFRILLALANGERHGYAVAKEVEASTGGAMRLGPGTLYRLIKQMVEDGWIAEVERTDPADSRRRYYHLTPRGRSIAAAEAERLVVLVRLARSRKLLPASIQWT